MTRLSLRASQASLGWSALTHHGVLRVESIARGPVASTPRLHGCHAIAGPADPLAKHPFPA